jgi:hypothetical protein
VRAFLSVQRRLEQVQAFLTIFQFTFFIVLTYQPSTLQANSAILTISALLLAFFVPLQAALLFLSPPGQRLRTSFSIVHSSHLFASLALFLPFFPYINSYFGFSFLRLLPLAIIAPHLADFSEAATIRSFLINVGLRLLVFILVYASLVGTLERAGNPAGWDVPRKPGPAQFYSRLLSNYVLRIKLAPGGYVSSNIHVWRQNQSSSLRNATATTSRFQYRTTTSLSSKGARYRNARIPAGNAATVDDKSSGHGR